MKLEDLLLYGRTFEQSEIHAKNIEHGTQPEASEPIVQRFQPRRQQRSKRTFFASRDTSKSPHKFGNPKPNSKQKCFSCGYDFPHVKGPCPAKTKNCVNCGKIGHFASVCRSKPYRNVKEVTKYEEATVDATDSESDSSDWDLYMTDVDVFEEPHKSVNVNAIAGPATFKTSLKFRTLSLSFHIDKGSPVNVVDGSRFDYLCKHLGKLPLAKTNVRLRAYGNKPLKVLGKFSFAVESNKKFVVTYFFVVQGNGGCLLSGETALLLQLIKIPQECDTLRTISQLSPIGKLT